MAAVTICSDFGAQKNKVWHRFHCFPIYFPRSDVTRFLEFKFSECWVLSQLFHSPLSLSSRGSLVLLQFLPFEWYHLLIWSCWYFPWQSWFHFVNNLAQNFTWCTLHINIMDNHWKALSMEMAWYSLHVDLHATEWEYLTEWRPLPTSSWLV